MFTFADYITVHVHNSVCNYDKLCVLQVFYSFSFWLMFRQQLKERQEEQNLKEESLDDVHVVSRNLFWIAFLKIMASVSEKNI